MISNQISGFCNLLEKRTDTSQNSAIEKRKVSTRDVEFDTNLDPVTAPVYTSGRLYFGKSSVGVTDWVERECPCSSIPRLH